tara:strand:+ start:154 stop:594 length:441 start_codon:yes stop_codon:yes gene_type:complete
MEKVIAIDPGMYKCGLIVADIQQKKINIAEVIKSRHFLNYVKNLNEIEKNPLFLIGNGTSSKIYISALSEFTSKLIIAEEKNSTFRAKNRYFDIFPVRGILKYFLPREVFILNKNLDALAALIILEDYYSCKFEIGKQISTRTWLK